MVENQYFIQVSNLSDLVTNIIPFYDEYSIYAAIYLDFFDFKRGVNIVESKLHLTIEGLEELKKMEWILFVKFKLLNPINTAPV